MTGEVLRLIVIRGFCYRFFDLLGSKELKELTRTQIVERPLLADSCHQLTRSPLKHLYRVPPAGGDVQSC